MITFKKTKPKKQSYLPVIQTDPHSVASEQYWKLKSNIELSNFDQKIKVIGVTSTFEKEGKSLTVINLATTYENSNLKTLIIDLDLRKPKVHRGFNIINKIGISDMVIDGLKIEDVRNVISEKLHVITSGKKLPFPAEFLMSKQIKLIIESLSSEYDRIIIDTPPLTVFADATIIGTLCDGIVFVIKSNAVDAKHAKQALKELEENQVNVIGAVLTQVSRKGKGYYKYYNYYKD